MTSPRPARLAAALTGIAMLATACGPTARPAASPKTANDAAPLSAATSVVTTSRDWATLVLGDTTDHANAFWQLLARPATGGNWPLVTPPGVASNGGLVIAPTGPSSLLAGFLPSQELLFTPLATTANSGATWSRRRAEREAGRHP